MYDLLFIHGVAKSRIRCVTSLSLFTFMHWRRNGNLLQCSWLENTRDRGAWWAAAHGVAQSQIRLKRLRAAAAATQIQDIQLKSY